MKYCQECGSNNKVSYSEDFNQDLCPICLKMNIEHPVNTLPPVGEIRYDLDGRPICHICGRAYNKLMQHARLKHGLSALEYKKSFGLNVSKGIIATRTAEILRSYVDKNYEVVVENNLLKNGRKTRFETGCEGRTKEKLSLQALKDLQNRKKD